MSDETTTTTETPKDKTTLLDRIQKEVTARGKSPDQKETTRLVGRLAADRAKVEKLEADLEAAKGELSKSSGECIRAFGKQPLNIDGTILDPMCREETLYYRPRSKSEGAIVFTTPKK